jgi:hypothetical protein
MLHHIPLAAAAASDLLTLTGMAAYWAGYRAGPASKAQRGAGN